MGPTDSLAIGALVMAESMLCHSHAIPSISSYSAKPEVQSAKKNPSLCHFWKYAWTELELPNCSFGKAFH